jgi:hypothetical protein
MKDAKLLLALIEKAGSKGLSWTEIWEKMNAKEKTLVLLKNGKVMVQYRKLIGSKDTFSKMCKFLEKSGYIESDIETRKYRLTDDGQKYIQKSEIVDSILSSNQIDTYFQDWSPSSKQPAATLINLAQTTQTLEQGLSSHSLALLISRGRRTQPLEWLKDIMDYAIAVGLLDENKRVNILTNKDELEKLWKELFNGTERLTVIETVKPQLLLESLEQRLFESDKSVN